MLSRSSKIKTSSAIRSADSVQPLQDYIPHQHTQAAFPSIKKDLADAEKEEDKNSSAREDRQMYREEDYSALELLLPRSNFHELFARFFITGHKQLLMLQARIRKERGINRSFIFKLGDIDNRKGHILRGQFYQIQMILYNMSKGNNHRSSL